VSDAKDSLEVLPLRTKIAHRNERKAVETGIIRQQHLKKLPAFTIVGNDAHNINTFLERSISALLSSTVDD